MPSHLRLVHYGPGLNGYQSGARIVRQAREKTKPEYIRPGRVTSKRTVMPAASKSTNVSGRADVGTRGHLRNGPITSRDLQVRTMALRVHKASLYFDNLGGPWERSTMPTDQTRNVSLTAELNAFIRAQVASGQYQSASEVVRAALRLLIQVNQEGSGQQRRAGKDRRAPTA